MKDLKCNNSVFSNIAISKIAGITGIIGETEYKEIHGCDLHHYLFNTKQEFVYTAEAERACDEIGTFPVIALIKEYEKDNFGEMFTEIEPCGIANVFLYILGECLLFKSEHLKEKVWNEILTEEDLKTIHRELYSFLEEFDSDLSELAFIENGL